MVFRNKTAGWDSENQRAKLTTLTKVWIKRFLKGAQRLQESRLCFPFPRTDALPPPSSLLSRWWWKATWERDLRSQDEIFPPQENMPSKEATQSVTTLCLATEEVPIAPVHLPPTVTEPKRPEGADDWFRFYCFDFSFQCHPEWNRCLARPLDWKPLRPSFVLRHPSPPAEPPRPHPTSLWHLTSHAKGRELLAVGRSHYSLMTRPLWCPDDGTSVTHGGKSISHVLWEVGGQGRVCGVAEFVGRCLTLISSGFCK